MNRSLVLYHAKRPGGCIDGFGAAFAAWLKLREQADYRPIDHGDEPPFEDLPHYEHLYVLDYAWKMEPVNTMAQVLAFCQGAGIKLTLLDHHKTIAEGLPSLVQTEQDFVFVNTTKSGAVLAWEYFWPGRPLPRLLAYCQDRDLWQWKLPDSRALTNWLYFQPFDFPTWQGIGYAFENPGSPAFESIHTQALAMQVQTQSQITQSASTAADRSLFGLTVPVVNCPSFQGSDVMERLLEENPGALFAAAYYDRGTERVWGLRSKGVFDVEALARRVLGGGGHKQAAGFRSDRHDLVEWVRDGKVMGQRHLSGLGG